MRPCAAGAAGRAGGGSGGGGSVGGGGGVHWMRGDIVPSRHDGARARPVRAAPHVKSPPPAGSDEIRTERQRGGWGGRSEGGREEVGGREGRRERARAREGGRGR